MKNCLLLGALLMGFTGVAMAQSVTVDVPSGYKVVVVPDSVSVPQAVSVALTIRNGEKKLSRPRWRR